MTLLISSIVAYYFFSRLFLLFYFIFTNEPFCDYKNWREAFDGYERNSSPPVTFPFFGDIVFFLALLHLFFYYPFLIVGNGINAINDMIQHKKELKKNRLKYLKSLSDFCLTPKDIPKYINDSDSLRDYLKVWNDAVKESRNI